MANNVKAEKGKLRGTGLVRNAAGKPQFDDFNVIAEIFHDHLSVEDWEYIEQQRGLSNVDCT